ncbi:MAG: Mur ligase family protein [Bacillota bacterium]|nr:Mur ligase family protein [Bacillota bacterium]MDW7677909.1 Mur ligase family protein [Bacillota bacterium]
MSITAAIEFIELSHAAGTRLDLPTLKMMLHQLGDPHQRLKVIHVAGTNGVVVLEVGLGGLLDATNVIDDPLVAVITPIDIDHVDILGDDLAVIAAHKAGIIKPLRPVIYHHQAPLVDEVIRTTAKQHQPPAYCLQPHDVIIHTANLKEQIFDFSHPLHPMSQLTIRMMGSHQTNNASLALLTIQVLRHHGLLEISDEALASGLQQSFWAGRLEILHQSPLVIIDGAHNLQGAQILQQFLADHFPDRKIHFLMGMLNNKDISGVLNTLMPLGQKLFLTRATNPKAVNPETLAEQVQLFGKEVYAIDSMTEAVETALMQTAADEVLVITGSLYLVGDARTILLQFLDQQREAS